MRLGITILALHAVRQAVGSALYGEALNEENLITRLIRSPNFLPQHSRNVLEQQHQLQSKQSPPPGSGTTTASLIEQLGYILGGTIINGLTNSGYKAPVSKVADTMTSDSPVYPGAIRKKVRYGPYRIPPTSEVSMESRYLNASGMTSSFRFYAKKPCDGNCVILKIAPSMEYDDGSSAETKNGAWFHHSVLLNVGTSVKDPVCGQKYIENIYMSGNERTEAQFWLEKSSVKSGYHLQQGDAFILNSELMNMEDTQKWVWVTYTYDYLDGDHTEYKDGKVVWQTIGHNNCGDTSPNPFGGSNITAETDRPLKQAFSEHSPIWVIPDDAQLLGTTGHMHDGATGMDIFHNDKLICTSVPHYAKSGDGGMGMESGHGHGRRQLMGAPTSNNENEHISKQDPCIFEPPVQVKRGEKMWIRANYNFTEHPGMKTDMGDLDRVMGIAGSIFALPYPRPV